MASIGRIVKISADLQVFKLLSVLLSLLFLQFGLFAQSPEKAFNSPLHAVGIRVGISDWSINGQSEYFAITTGTAVQLSYDRTKPLRKWYNWGIGVHFGGLYRNAETMDLEKIYSVSFRNFTASVPVYVRRHFPINNKIGFSVKIGAETKAILNYRSTVSQGDKQSHLNVHYETNYVPQFDLLSGVGTSYTLKNNNFVLFELEWGCTLVNARKYKFEYINREVSDVWITDTFKAKYAQSITFALKYNFKLQKN